MFSMGVDRRQLVLEVVELAAIDVDVRLAKRDMLIPGSERW